MEHAGNFSKTMPVGNLFSKLRDRRKRERSKLKKNYQTERANDKDEQKYKALTRTFRSLSKTREERKNSNCMNVIQICDL